MSADARKKLIKHAKQLFADKGYHGVSIREIAGKAGLNSSLISYYFGGKLGLYKAILKEETAVNEGIMSAAREKSSPRDAVLEAVDQFEKTHDSCFVKIMARIFLTRGEKKLKEMTYNEFSSIFMEEGKKHLKACRIKARYKNMVDSDSLLLFIGSMIHFWSVFSDMLINIHGFKNELQIKKIAYKFTKDMIKEFVEP